MAQVPEEREGKGRGGVGGGGWLEAVGGMGDTMVICDI